MSWRFFIAILLSCGSAWAERDYSANQGYLEEVSEERYQQVEDLVLINPPAPLDRPLSERIFNAELTKEFEENYAQRFGRTYEQQQVRGGGKFYYSYDVYGYRGTQESMQKEKRAFGEYMLRRLAEYHVDKYAKNDPKLRPVWEAKEKISNVKIEIAEYRLDLNYSIVNNIFELKVVNPYLDSRISLMMPPGGLPGPIDEAYLVLGKQITPKWYLSNDWSLLGGMVTLTARRTLAANMSGTLSASRPFKERSPHEVVHLTGLQWNF